MYRIKKAAAAIYGWDRPLLAFIYPGFEQVAQLTFGTMQSQKSPYLEPL